MLLHKPQPSQNQILVVWFQPLAAKLRSVTILADLCEPQVGVMFLDPLFFFGGGRAGMEGVMFSDVL